MSYILEALKRADAERGERPASGLTPTEAGALEPTSTGRPSQRATVLALGACAALGLVAAGLWAWQSQRAPMVAAPGVVATNPLAAIETAPLETVATPALAHQPKSVPAPPPSPAETKAPEPPTTASPQRPTPVMPILAEPRPAPPPPAPVKRSAQAPQEAPETPQPAMPSLSAAQRAALPRIDISGSSYSTNPDLRMLIANGKVLKEGQALSPGLTLEVIGPHSAVFNQSGTRFNINY